MYDIEEKEEEQAHSSARLGDLKTYETRHKLVELSTGRGRRYIPHPHPHGILITFEG